MALAVAPSHQHGAFFLFLTFWLAVIMLATTYACNSGQRSFVSCTAPCHLSPQAISGMSPYLHYGQIAPQRAALEAAKWRAKYKESVEGFLEELVRQAWAFLGLNLEK